MPCTPPSPSHRVCLPACLPIHHHQHANSLPRPEPSKQKQLILATYLTQLTKAQFDFESSSPLSLYISLVICEYFLCPVPNSVHGLPGGRKPERKNAPRRGWRQRQTPRTAWRRRIKGSGDESRRPCDSILRQLKAKANAKAAHVRVEVALGSSLSS